MKNIKSILIVLAIFSLSFTPTTFKKTKFPFAKMGLTAEQAAVHLLERFGYGATAADINTVLEMGHEKWFTKQLEGSFDDTAINQKLAQYPILNLSYTEIATKMPLGPQLRNRIVKEGLLTNDDFEEKNREKIKPILQKYLTDNGLYDPRRMVYMTIAQKIMRAAESKNQLHETLTDFWFNHFNVSMGKNVAMRFVYQYERDAIRPNITGKFSDLVLATAKSPAMLYYLDNFLSSAENDTELQGNKRPRRQNKGLNENYAREVMELHTLGVDGGYTQSDVTNAAKIFTGWTIKPAVLSQRMNKNGNTARQEKFVNNGGILEEDFMFLPDRHTAGSKTVLGKTYNQNGFNEGLALLYDLANKQATAHFICKKIATRFVSDTPSETLIKAMEEVFIKTKGDIAKVMIGMVKHPMFWDKAALRQKSKSPFELAMSSVRCTGAKINQADGLYQWITKMGQKLYYYQAPTGFPDQAKYWVNTTSVLNRMNFGLAMANNKIKGVTSNCTEILQGKEPESIAKAIEAFAQILLPQRHQFVKAQKLSQIAQEPDIEQKIEEKITKLPTQMELENWEDIEDNLGKKTNKPKEITQSQALQQALGTIIGSPEFQRR